MYVGLNIHSHFVATPWNQPNCLGVGDSPRSFARRPLNLVLNSVTTGEQADLLGGSNMYGYVESEFTVI